MSAIDLFRAAQGGATPIRTHTEWLARERYRHRVVRGGQFGLLALFLVLWEVLPRAQIINPLFTSYPSALWPTLLELIPSTPQRPGLLTHVAVTLLTTVAGFVLAMALGTLIAAAFWWFERLHKVLEPFLVVANAMPKTAFVPIFYLWLGPWLSILAMSLAISLLVAILVIHSGFSEVDPKKLALARGFGASRMQLLTKVVLPASVPTFIAALKITAGLSLVGVLVGEFQSASVGLGYLIQYGSQIFAFNMVMLSIAILAVISTAMYWAISWLESRVSSRAM